MWLDHLPRLHAEKIMTFENLSELELDQIGDIVFQATQDKEQASKIKMEIYRRRMENSVMND